MVHMKSWLAWLRKSGYEFTETVDEVNGCRTYDFGNALVVIKCLLPVTSLAAPKNSIFISFLFNR